MKPAIFVYGTLRSDVEGSRFRLMKNYATFAGYGRIGGRLYDLGRYPAVVLDDARRQWVRGEIYYLRKADEAFRILDDYEGCGSAGAFPQEFARRRGEATLDNGDVIEVWIYVFTGSVSHRSELQSGDFAERSM